MQCIIFITFHSLVLYSSICSMHDTYWYPKMTQNKSQMLRTSCGCIVNLFVVRKNGPIYCARGCPAKTRYSGHQNSHLVQTHNNMYKQTTFTFIWESTYRASCWWVLHIILGKSWQPIGWMQQCYVEHNILYCALELDPLLRILTWSHKARRL